PHRRSARLRRHQSGAAERRGARPAGARRDQRRRRGARTLGAEMKDRTFHGRPRNPVRIWVPLSVLVWLILMPLAVVATPLVFVAAPFWRLNSFAAVGALFSLLIALCGVRIDVDTPDAHVHLF